jgi:osmotically-inducible protein OsmY
MKKKYLITLFAVASVLLLYSTSLRGSETDDRIVTTAEKSFVFKTYLKDDAVKTESNNGAVTLTGTVNQASHKALAQNTVESLPGVQSVNNLLIIKGESPEENSDGWIALKVKTALLFHRHVSATKTSVSVKEGAATLTGEASSSAQKELTTEVAKDIEGVKSVNNNMTIAKVMVQSDETLRDKIDDASITAQVRMSLMTHRSTSALNTKVTTADGVVTLSGEAKNAAEKSLATKLVADINGVSSVINNMTIAVTAASN